MENTAYITVGSRATVDAKDSRRVDVCGDYLYCYGCGQVLPKSEFNASNGWHNRYCRVCRALNQRMYSEKKELGGKFTAGSIPRKIYLRNKKMKKQRIDEAKILAQKPTSNYAVCVRYSSCVHGSLVRKRCGIKHHKSKGCKLYDEFLGYNIPVSVEFNN